ncbi:MAG: alpha-galactosidase [Armatimonadetes bacterium]|nr:alpha-galactosidase [Armatimonadota bacterium]
MLPLILSATSPDWLIDASPYHAKLEITADHVEISNGLITRRFDKKLDWNTVGLSSHGSQLLRALSPEAVLVLNGKPFSIGTAGNQQDRAFLLRSDLEDRPSVPNAFRLVNVVQVPIEATVPWNQRRWTPGKLAWPPKGIAFDATFAPTAGTPEVQVTLHYELYDGIPLIGKRMRVTNTGNQSITVDSFVLEHLGLFEAESYVDDSPEWRKPNVTAFTDYTFGGMALNNSNRTVFWEPDPEYKTQVNYNLKTPCDLVVKPPLGPSLELAPKATFTTFRSFVLTHDSTERERQALAIRRAYRVLAPWTEENPIMLHLTSTDPAVVHKAIDQATECGFEMIVISFWSGLDMEDTSEANVRKFREFRDYAHKKGLQLGGYSLLASRRIDDQNDVINPKTGKTGGAIFGQSPCLGSQWGQQYFAKIQKFLSETEFDLLEHDGSYPGDVCASTSHPGHKGLDDSQWTQRETIGSFYRWCREKGIYLNVPDNYFLSGSNKTGMGYREVNWSLPRALQHIHARQNLYDGTWDKNPSMGWMMTPLVEYQGGGAEATIEPLDEHLDDYAMHLTNNLGYGAQSCYRGPRIYDTERTRAMVIDRIEWFKKYRAILQSDVIHVRRPDGQNLDAILHVNPKLNVKGMLLVWNPTDMALTQELAVPLYYTGLLESATVSESDQAPTSMPLDRFSNMLIKVTVPARGMKWFVVR